MAIQYSGLTIINQTFTNTVGTRLEIVTGLQNALINAGWTVISGINTASVVMSSATTPNPQNLLCYVNLVDPGANNCAQIKFRNQANSKSQSNYLPLFPQTGKVWRVIANPYQFFIFSTSSVGSGREFACGGVPSLPSFLQGVITECIWAMGNGASDTDAVCRNSFRTVLGTNMNTNQGSYWLDCNLNAWEWFNTTSGTYYSGLPQLFVQVGSSFLQNSGTGAYPPYSWHDDSLLTYEPLIGWGLTGSGDQCKIRGQIWDAAVISDQFTADQTTTFDTRNWWILTNSNAGTSQNFARGSLLLVTP